MTDQLPTTDSPRLLLEQQQQDLGHEGTEWVLQPAEHVRTYSDLLISDAVGIYIPQEFCRMLREVSNMPNEVSAKDVGLNPEDVSICLGGPDHDYYWEAWNRILGNYQYTDNTGAVWSLWQDGELRAIEYQPFHNFEDETGVNPFEL